MIRIEFSADDIARTTVLPTLGPFAETVLGLGSLRMSPQVAAPLRTAAARIGKPLAELADFMAPIPTVQLDLFSLLGPTASFGAGAESLLAASTSRLTDEIRQTRSRVRNTPSWLRGIETGALPARRRVNAVLAELHRHSVEPFWPAMSATLAAERHRLLRLLGDGGVERLLAGFHPLASWRSGVLELPTAGRWAMRPLTARLDGTGLMIAPSVYCPVGPVPYFPYDGSPAVLLYPVPFTAVVARSGNALPTLLGRTRAAVLETIADGCTTTELANRLGISPASASQHATALRTAGLVLSTRDGNRMLHSLTALGANLLSQTVGTDDGLGHGAVAAADVDPQRDGSLARWHDRIAAAENQQ